LRRLGNGQISQGLTDDGNNAFRHNVRRLLQCKHH
jgi:hypothetical protein